MLANYGLAKTATILSLVLVCEWLEVLLKTLWHKVTRPHSLPKLRGGVRKMRQAPLSYSHAYRKW
jgi:hypothetical protein